jgi:hypothetical protein
MGLAGGNYQFTPQALVLTYQSALWLSQADLFGLGRGVLAVRYQDDSTLAGDYTLFLQVDEVVPGESAAARCPPPSTATFSGDAVLTTDIVLTDPADPSARGPFHKHLDLTLQFAECGRAVRVGSFTPFDTDPFQANGVEDVINVSSVGTGVGTFDPATGRLDLPVRLHFADRALQIPSSEVSLAMSTATMRGTAWSGGGRAALVGTGQFERGWFFNGRHCELTVDGTLTRNP